MTYLGTGWWALTKIKSQTSHNILVTHVVHQLSSLKFLLPFNLGLLESASVQPLWWLGLKSEGILFPQALTLFKATKGF